MLDTLAFVFLIHNPPAGVRFGRARLLPSRAIMRLGRALALQAALKEPRPPTSTPALTVTVKDRQGNISRVERTFSAGKRTSRQ